MPNLCRTQPQAVWTLNSGCRNRSPSLKSIFSMAARARSMRKSPTRSRPSCFRSRSRRLKCQRTLTNLARASQFHSAVSSSSGRFSSRASSTWPSAIRSACSRATHFGRGEIQAAEVPRLELDGQLLGRPAGERLGDRSPCRGIGPGSGRSAGRSSPGSTACNWRRGGCFGDSRRPVSLFVHHLVVFEEVFADLEVAFFDLFLRPSMRRETMWLSMASPSFMPSRVRMFLTHSPAKIRIRSSSSER